MFEGVEDIAVAVRAPKKNCWRALVGKYLQGQVSLQLGGQVGQVFKVEFFNFVFEFDCGSRCSSVRMGK